MIQEKKLGRRKALGLYENGKVYVDPRLNERTRLGTVIHEFLHKTQPDLSEEAVLRIEDVIANALWRDGWRRNVENSPGRKRASKERGKKTEKAK